MVGVFYRPPNRRGDIDEELFFQLQDTGSIMLEGPDLARWLQPP